MEVNEAKALIERILRDQITPARLTQVVVAEDFDSDGDPILRVRAIYDSSAPMPEAEKLFSATAVVRLSLILDGEQRFPLLSFISSDDAKGMAA